MTMRLNHSPAYAGETLEGDSVPLNVAYYADPADEFGRPADIEIEDVYAAEDVVLPHGLFISKGAKMPIWWAAHHYKDIHRDCKQRLEAESI